MFKDFIEFLRNRKPIMACWKEKKKQCREEAHLAEQLDAAGLPADIAYHLGTAIGFARDTGIELYQGLTYGDCRAVLPRSAWRYDTGNPEESFLWGQFLYKHRKDVTEIQYLNCNICFAIAKCALFARGAGVI